MADHSHHDMHGDMGKTMAMEKTEPMKHDMGDMNMSMAMTFHLGFAETILFDGWQTTTVGGMIGSCIGIFFIAILYEALKYYREYLFKQSSASVTYSSVGGPNMDAARLHKSISKRILSAGHFVQTFLHILQVAISYFLMLVFMTYNVWLCISVVLGAGVGFFIFGWKKTIVVDITEHCH